MAVTSFFQCFQGIEGPHTREIVHFLNADDVCLRSNKGIDGFVNLFRKSCTVFYHGTKSSGIEAQNFKVAAFFCDEVMPAKTGTDEAHSQEDGQHRNERIKGFFPKPVKQEQNLKKYGGRNEKSAESGHPVFFRTNGAGIIAGDGYQGGRNAEKQHNPASGSSLFSSLFFRQIRC